MGKPSYRRARRYLETGKVITTAANTDHDNDERFVIRHCLVWMQRHINRFFYMDQEALEILCWLLGSDMVMLGEYVLECFEGSQQDEFAEELADANLNPNDYSYSLTGMVGKIKRRYANKFRNFIIYRTPFATCWFFALQTSIGFFYCSLLIKTQCYFLKVFDTVSNAEFFRFLSGDSHSLFCFHHLLLELFYENIR